MPLVAALAIFIPRQEEFAALGLFIFALISFQRNPWRVRAARSLAAVGGAVAEMVLTQPVSNGRFELGNPGKRKGWDRGAVNMAPVVIFLIKLDFQNSSGFV